MIGPISFVVQRKADDVLVIQAFVTKFACRRRNENTPRPPRSRLSTSGIPAQIIRGPVGNVFGDQIAAAGEGRLAVDIFENRLRKIQHVHTFCRHVGKLLQTDTGAAATTAVRERTRRLNTELACQTKFGDGTAESMQYLKLLEQFLVALKL